MWALVSLELVLELGVWLALRVFVSQPSMSANCSLILSLWQTFDYEWVEVDLLDVRLVIGAFSQFGLLSVGTILGLEVGKTIHLGWIV